MRHLQVVVYILFCGFSALAQRVVVSPDKMNVFYIGVPNPVTAMAEGYNCDEVMLSIEGAAVTKRGECSYDIEVTRAGKVLVSVQVKTSSGIKTIGSIEYRTKFIPDPVAKLAGKTRGFIPASLFKAQIGVIAYYENFDFDVRFVVTGYNVMVSRGKEVVFNSPNKGSKFNDEVKAIFASLRAGDKIFISDVKAVGPDKRTRTLNEIELMLN